MYTEYFIWEPFLYDIIKNTYLCIFIMQCVTQKSNVNQPVENLV